MQHIFLSVGNTMCLWTPAAFILPRNCMVINIMRVLACIAKGVSKADPKSDSYWDWRHCEQSTHCRSAQVITEPAPLTMDRVCTVCHAIISPITKPLFFSYTQMGVPPQNFYFLFSISPYLLSANTHNSSTQSFYFSSLICHPSVCVAANVAKWEWESAFCFQLI